MTAAALLQAIGLFIATNIDDIIVLSLFFARGAGRPGTTAKILAGQYLGFVGILAAGGLGEELVRDRTGVAAGLTVAIAILTAGGVAGVLVLVVRVRVPEAPVGAVACGGRPGVLIDPCRAGADQGHEARQDGRRKSR